MTTPEGEGAQSGAEGTQSGAGTDPGNNGGTNSGTSGEGTQSGTEQQTPPTDMVAKAEADALRERMRAADKRAADFEAKLKQLTDKDLPEAQKLQRDYEESQQQVETLQATNNSLALKVAFLEDNTYTWQNPKRAQQLIDMSQVEIGADGAVTGLKEALKALATSDPYLLKQEVKEEVKPPASTATGNNGSSAGKPSTKGMASRIPALNSRVRRG